MTISKSKLETLVKDLPKRVDIEDVMYRLYLLQKIETSEKSVREGRTVKHKDVIKRLAKRWQK